jgi:YkoY family integral membrane protein
MEAETVPSLSPLLAGADQWHEFLLLLPLLVALEAILSADNAIALAAISKRLHNPANQKKALDFGLLLALALRLLLIIAARWVLNFWPLQLAASLYLLWLSGKQILSVWSAARVDTLTVQQTSSPEELETGEAQSTLPPAVPSVSNVILTLALTDLAFSLDSIAAAVAVTDRLLIVMAGGVIGIGTLRLTAGLFNRWLDLYPNLETAGYVAVGLVGLRLLVRLGLPQLAPPEWLLLTSVTLLLVWGFSLRRAPGQEDTMGSEADVHNQA